MGSKHKQSRMEQKASFERRLEDRLSYLSKKGIESPKINKDVLVKKLRADIKAVNTRLKAIADNEKRTEDLARIKAEKAAAPKEDQKGSKDKKSKEAPAEGKEKKAAAPKKDQEGGKVKKAKETPTEGKEKADAPKEDQEGSKDKKTKETPAEGKEKAAAPKKDQEGGKVKKAKEAPAEGKEKKKKKEDNTPEATE